MTTPEEGAPPGEAQQPPAQYLPPQRPTTAAATAAPASPGVPAPSVAEEPLSAVKPARLWYWVFGPIFPANLLISILLLSNNPGASPPLIVFGVVTPILTFFVSLIGCVTVLIIRSVRVSNRRAERARQARLAHMAASGVPTPYPGQQIHAAQPGNPAMQAFVPHMPPIKIPAKDARPRRRWMLVGALIFPLAFALGMTGFWAVGNSEAAASPEFASEIVQGTGSVTFQVSQDQVDSLGLYSTGSFEEEDGFFCDLAGPSYAGFTEKVVAYSYGEWRLVESAVITFPGTYTLDCSGPDSMEFVIADTDVAVAYDDAMLSAFAMMMLSCFLGFVASLAVVITVGVKRGNHRARLIREHQARMYQTWTQGQGQGQNTPQHNPT